MNYKNFKKFHLKIYWNSHILKYPMEFSFPMGIFFPKVTIEFVIVLKGGDTSKSFIYGEKKIAWKQIFPNFLQYFLEFLPTFIFILIKNHIQILSLLPCHGKDNLNPINFTHESWPYGPITFSIFSLKSLKINFFF